MMRHLRSIMRLTWKDKVTNKEILGRIGLPSMEDLLIKKNLLWTGHLMRMSSDRLPKQILYSQLSSGHRQRGRPRLRFKDTIKRNLKLRDIKTDSWTSLSQQRTKWMTSPGLSCPDPGMDIDDESMALTIQDSETGTATMYDAYVVYADKDFTFVREMIDQLEAKFGLRLCISNRDMLAGSAEFQAVAALIKKRCKKVIVVMSPAFKCSPMCTFATNFAFSLCPSTLQGILVPILYKSCQIPDLLLYIAPLDFTKVEYIQWFWERLQHSLRPRHVTGDQSLLREQPPPYEESDRARSDINVDPCDDHEGATSEAVRCIADARNSTGDVGGAIANPDGGDTVIHKTPSPSDRIKTPRGKGKKKYFFTILKPKTKQQAKKGHVTTVGS
ncbi:hypothetical protein LSAT2_002487 [Lamellibrachia satsuma]|nr:hypothetical protein LSAT2_002487 [Lamellibrachia satsuma]